jgi:hypothetical protein
MCLDSPLLRERLVSFLLEDEAITENVTFLCGLCDLRKVSRQT